MKADFLYRFSLVNLIRCYEKTELQKLFSRLFMLSCQILHKKFISIKEFLANNLLDKIANFKILILKKTYFYPNFRNTFFD